ncbi:hypothetical protein ACQEVB_20460 [Pseudonocardia sp. CA-107938]|uniref:hypothetical protein n=1 Tax=Pseudonocardia sp. CA-107938 TaxID=3240021 RepID=UPI003D8ECBB4
MRRGGGSLGARSAALVAALVAALLLLLAPVPAAAQQPVPPDPIGQQEPEPPPCQGQLTAAEATKQKIDAHNARPHQFVVPRQAAALQAYDAEAAALNAEQQTTLTALRSCLLQLQNRLAIRNELHPQVTGAPPPLTISSTRRDAIRKGRDGLPAGWPPVNVSKRPAVPRGTPARPLYDAIRQGNPKINPDVDAVLQGRSRPQVGDPDPSRPGRQIQARSNGNAAVSADHIITIARLMYTAEFIRLRPDDMWAVATAASNLQWIASDVNSMKGSGSMSVVAGIDPKWRADQVALEKRTLAALIDIMKRIHDTYGEG